MGLIIPISPIIIDVEKSDFGHGLTCCIGMMVTMTKMIRYNDEIDERNFDASEHVFKWTKAHPLIFIVSSGTNSKKDIART